jgi:hypothetical protein
MSVERTTQLTEAIHGISVRQRVTNNTAIATTIAPGKRFLLKEVRLHLSAVGASGDLTITLDSGTNAVYDVVLLKQDLTSLADLVYQPVRPLEFESTDEIDIAWANAGGKTYGLEVLYTII